MNQSDVFLSGEGDAWFHRNKAKLGKRDPVSDLLGLLPLIRPKRVLEVGCANGWRLKKLQATYGCRVSGIDTSADAVAEAVENGLDDVCHGKFGPGLHAWLGGTFDMIIFGFCLYVTEPRDWFKMVAESDRLLADGGHLVIHDTLGGDSATGYYAVPYSHKEGLLSYHVDFAELWNGHPWYVERDSSDLWAEGEKVTILHKVTNAIRVRA